MFYSFIFLGAKIGGLMEITSKRETLPVKSMLAMKSRNEKNQKYYKYEKVKVNCEQNIFTLSNTFVKWWEMCENSINCVYLGQIKQYLWNDVCQKSILKHFKHFGIKWQSQKAFKHNAHCKMWWKWHWGENVHDFHNKMTKMTELSCKACLSTAGDC